MGAAAAVSYMAAAWGHAHDSNCGTDWRVLEAVRAPLLAVPLRSLADSGAYSSDAGRLATAEGRPGVSRSTAVRWSSSGYSAKARNPSTGSVAALAPGVPLGVRQGVIL